MDCYKGYMVWILYELKWLGTSVYNGYSKMVIGLMAIGFRVLIIQQRVYYN
jgi:hypothetical protein